MTVDSVHTDKGSAPPPALSGRGSESTRSLDHTIGFVRTCLKLPSHNTYATATP